MTTDNAQLLAISKPEPCGSGTVMSNVSAPRDPNVTCPFGLIEFSVEPNCVTEPDEHEAAEIWYITRGRGCVLTPDGQISVTAGDFVYLRPGQVHQIENTGDELISALSVYWSNRA